MTKNKKVGKKGSGQFKKRCNGKNGKNGKQEQENPVTQAKMFCTEAASHEKGGNYNRALHCYNLNPPEGTVMMKKGNTDQEANVEEKIKVIEDEEEKGDEKVETPKAEKPDAESAKKLRKKKGKRSNKQAREKAEKTKKQETKLPSPRLSSKSTFTQIAKELKARRLAQIAHAAAMAKKRKKNRVLRDEEIYTDKDRAAAVNMGTTDIKQSLKLKKKLDKSPNSQIPEEAEPATLLALGNNELRNGDLKTALQFMNKALQLNPDDKNGLVARSKCYLSLGDPQLALTDAETALVADKTFVRAIYQKAEALYHLGDFEHSLMYYHRGHRLRPELECFRLGVQKAQEAIENTIGSTAKLSGRKADKVPRSSSSSPKTEEDDGMNKSTRGNETKRSLSSMGSEKGRKKRSKSAAPKAKSSSSRFIGELVADKLYLENLLKHPDLICSNQQATSIIRKQAEEGISFLKSRQEFWRQQRPNNSSNKTTRRDSQRECSEPTQEK